MVLAAAVERFRLRGYHGTSMRDIAEGAGLVVAGIYHHFPSKQSILQEIMLRGVRDGLAATQSAVGDAVAMGRTSPPERLDAVVDAWILFHATRQAEAYVGATEIRSLEPAGRAVVVAHRDDQEELFRSIVLDGVARGAFATDYPREAARVIIEMGRSVATWYRRDGEMTPAEVSRRYRELARAAVSTYEAGHVA